jgi:hypothetical protein
MIARTSSGRVTRAFAYALAFTIAAGCGRNEQREKNERIEHGVWIGHVTDPHLFIPLSQDPDKAKKDSGEKQEKLNEKALADTLRRIGSLPEGDGPPAFLVFTGDLGVDPCDIAKTTPPPAAQPKPPPNSTAAAVKTPEPAKDCEADDTKRKAQVDKLATLLGSSPVQKIYLVAGNNDVAREQPGGAELGYFNKLIDDVQAKIIENKSNVQLHNLTGCYGSGGDPRSCYADAAGTSYRLIGFPSYSFKNETGSAESATTQEKQFQVFRGLVDQARQDGKKVLIVSHIPEIDDPYLLAQDRYAGKQPTTKKIDTDAKSSRSAWSAWNVSKKLQDDWSGVIASDSVAGVLAGHLHDSHKEIYRAPYTWSTLNDHRAGLGKLFLAPPLAVKRQDESPIQARGFSLVRLGSDSIEPLLYWYNSEAGDFTPEGRLEVSREHHRHGWRWWQWPPVAWLWGLDHIDDALIRIAVLLIALLTAFLTVVAIWQIPPPQNSTDGQKTADQSAATASPFTSKFGQTVLAGLGGLAVTEIAKSLGTQQASADTKWYYIVWFILFFFLLLLSLNGVRAVVEGVRARVTIPYWPLRPPNTGYPAWQIFVHWIFSVRIPVLTLLDTFINLIQGKNQTETKAMCDTITLQQGNLVRVADSIRKNLNQLMQRKIMAGHTVGGAPAPPEPVRVNISVMSADQSSLFYISRTTGSAPLEFKKKSVAWVSVFTGEIRWYESDYKGKNIELFDNAKDVIVGEGQHLMLDNYYQARGQDYKAFVVFPVPWPQRGAGTQYVKGAIHISFREDADFKCIWDIAPAASPPAESPPNAELRRYPTPELMLQPTNQRGWCKDEEVSATLRNSIMVLGELLHGFNEEIYKNLIQPKQQD